MKVEIRSHGPGKENVLIDGEKVGEKLRIAAAQVQVNPHEPPRLILTCLPDEITFNGETTEESMTFIIGQTLYSLIPEAELKQVQRQLWELQFREAVNQYSFGWQHDPDAESRRQAADAAKEILRLRELIGLKKALPIWNAKVRQVVTKEYQDEYLWVLGDTEE